MALNFTRPGTPAPQASKPATSSAGAVPARVVQPAAAGNIFAGVENVKASFAANYVKDGRYFALIRNVKTSNSRKGAGFVAVEMTILVSLPGKENHMREGEECAHLMMATNDSFLPNVKAFIAAVAGCSPDEVTSEMCSEIAPQEGAGDSPLAGYFIEFEATTIITKAKQQPFTKVVYKRSITATELAQHATNMDVMNLALGAGTLEKLVAAEAAQQS